MGKSNLTWTSNVIMKLNATIWFLNAINFLKVHKVIWNSIMLKVFKMKQRYYLFKIILWNRITSVWVGVNCSKFDCSTIISSTLLAANQLLDTKLINCLNPVNPNWIRAVDTQFFATVKCKSSIFFI